MKREEFKSAPFILIFSALTLFAISFDLLLLAGVQPWLDLMWNVLSSLDVNYQMLPQAVSESPLVFTASLVDAFIFAALAVALAALFFDFLKRINLSERRVIARIRGLRGHVILVPYNNFADYLSAELKNVGVECVIIAERESEVRSLHARRQMALVGDPKSTEIFRTAGLARAKYVIACSDDDVQNALITVTAKSVSQKAKIMSRITDIENISKLGRAGAYRMIMPEVTAGTDIAGEIVRRSGGAN